MFERRLSFMISILPTMTFTWDALTEGDWPPNDCVTGTAITALSNGIGRKVKETRGGTSGDTYYYGYTAEGRTAIIAHVAPSATCSDVTEYTYDGNGNVMSVFYPVADRTYTSQHRIVGYVYGTLSTGDDPDAIRSVDLMQDTEGSLTPYETLLTGVDHPTWGNGYTWTYNAATPVTYALTANTDGTPQSLTASSSAGYLVNRQYAEDLNGNLTASTDDIIGPTTALGTSPTGTAVGFRSDQYTYDFANRLTSDANSLGTQSYTLDQVGRITGTSFSSGTQASALGLATETATSSVTYNTSGQPSAANETDVQDGATDDEQDLPTITADASGNAASVTQNNSGSGGDDTLAITFGTDQSAHLSAFNMTASEDGTEMESLALTHQADSQYRQTGESASATIPGEGTFPVMANTFYYGSGGEMLSLQGAASDCIGQSVDGELCT